MIVNNAQCRFCGKEFHIKPFALTRGRGKYCNKTCFNLYIVGKRSSENNPSWKGDKAGYVAKHIWMKSHYGTPNYCDNCHTLKAKQFDWANISKTYKRIREDWLRLCKSCHVKFDDTINKGWKTRKASIL